MLHAWRNSTVYFRLRSCSYRNGNKTAVKKYINSKKTTINEHVIKYTLREIDIQLQLSDNSPNPILFTKIKSPLNLKNKQTNNNNNKEKEKRPLCRMLPDSYQPDLLAHSLARRGNEGRVRTKSRTRKKYIKKNPKKSKVSFGTENITAWLLAVRFIPQTVFTPWINTRLPQTGCIRTEQKGGGEQEMLKKLGGGGGRGGRLHKTVETSSTLLKADHLTLELA